MKAQCDRCKEIVPLHFTIQSAAIEVHCPSCDARYPVPASDAPPRPPSSSPAPPSPAAFHCPKCHAAQPRGEACPRCGLVFAKWRGPEATADAAAAASVPSVQTARSAAELFAAAEAAWFDPEAHERFVRFCQQSGALAYAAGRYRAAQVTRGADDPVIAARLQQIRSLAEAALARTPPPAGRAAAGAEPEYKNLKILMVGLIALLFAGGVWAVFFRPPPREAERPDHVPTPVLPGRAAPVPSRAPPPGAPLPDAAPRP